MKYATKSEAEAAQLQQILDRDSDPTEWFGKLSGAIAAARANPTDDRAFWETLTDSTYHVAARQCPRKGVSLPGRDPRLLQVVTPPRKTWPPSWRISSPTIPVRSRPHSAATSTKARQRASATLARPAQLLGAWPREQCQCQFARRS